MPENPYPSDRDPGEQTGGERGELAGDIRERLRALDELYAAGQITAVELGSARQRVLEGPGTSPSGVTPDPRDATTPMPASSDADSSAGDEGPQEPASQPESGDAARENEPPDGGRRVLGLPVGGAVAIGLGVLLVLGGIALAVVLAGGSSSDDAPEAAAADAGSDDGYLVVVGAPFDRLSDSAVAISRTVARTDKPADLVRVERNADQQLVVVERARRTLAKADVAPPDRPRHEALLAASATQRRYLVTLGRVAGLPPAQGLRQLKRLRAQGEALENRYERFFTLAPGAPDAITGTDLTDTTGLQAALREKSRAAQAAAREEAEEEAQQTPAPAPAPSGGGSATGGPAVSAVRASDIGGTIDISADYCDRTPGSVNEFLYTFTLSRGGVVEAADSYSASQTRACNTISFSFPDRFPNGAWDARVTVDNLTNGVSGSGATVVIIS